MVYDVIVIGAGLSGLTAASLLSKKNLNVCVIENSSKPGGSCGAFKRNDVIYDQGAAMIYGFGEKGFNSHRFVFNCLQEPIDILKHDILYTVNYNGNKIPFWPDIDKFCKELSKIFPSQKNNIIHFYKDMLKLYNDVIIETPNYTTADETNPKSAVKSMLKHPSSYIKFLSLLNKSTESLLKKYFTDKKIFDFFSKLTSTYCYTTVKESPAVLAGVMFVDNHVGGSYYPAGSTLFLPGKLEKVIEENNGEMVYNHVVKNIIFNNRKPVGVKLENNKIIYSKNIIYSGTVWNLYSKLIDKKYISPEKYRWAMGQLPTYSSLIMYFTIDKSVIPADTSPIEMLCGNPEKTDENEMTLYILSIDDRTLCKEDEHTVVAIGPSFQKWDVNNLDSYNNKKEQEEKRIITLLNNRFPGFKSAIRHKELATPYTIEQYTLKNGGAVAGPKQSLGQHMFKRLHTRTEWDNFFCCGESTVMGTGTPTVTTSGITAANVILKKYNKEPYVYKNNMKNYVNIIEKPFTKEKMYLSYSEAERNIMNKALKCQMCLNPSCCKNTNLDIPSIMRRVMVGNFIGAKKCIMKKDADSYNIIKCQDNCILKRNGKEPVNIKDILLYLKNYK